MKQEEMAEIFTLLGYSWKDINYEYDSLTDGEKYCISRETFEKVVFAIKLLNKH